MNTILIIPFKVHSNSVIIENQNLYKKVISTQDELTDEIMNGDNQLILTYNYPLITDNTDIFFIDYYGSIYKIDDSIPISAYAKLIKKQKETMGFDLYPDRRNFTDKTDLHESFTKELQFYLASEAFNSIAAERLERIQIRIETDVDDSIRTCLDLLRDIINVKYRFVGDISVVIHSYPYKSLYEDIFTFNNSISDSEMQTVFKSHDALKTINKLLKRIVLKEEYEDGDELSLDCCLFMENVQFITTNGYAIKLHCNGTYGIEKYEIKNATSTLNLD